MSVESSASPSSASQSEIIPALMLAALVTITGVEAVMVMGTPHKVMAHTLTQPMRLAQAEKRR